MSVFEHLGRHVAAEQDALRARSSDRAIARRRLEAFEFPKRAERTRARLVAIATFAAAAAILAALVVFRAASPEIALTATVGSSGQPATAGTWLEAPDGEGLALRFSEGTRIDMEPKSRARLVSLGPTGAHVVLESGRAQVTVNPRPKAAWLIGVGPFGVHVTGTRFEIRWDPDEDDFELELEEGHVELSGCLFGQAYRLSQGEMVRASCKHTRLQVLDRVTRMPRPDRPVGAESSTGIVSTPEPRSEPTPGKSSGSRRMDPKRISEESPSWRHLANDGKYAEAFAAANEAGFDAQCQQANADDLALLGDAAQFAGDAGKAARAFEAIRRRFPGTAKAGEAAFALGRLAFERAPAKAAEWFRTYLLEQPNGRLVREARGRLMEAFHRAGDSRSARDAAGNYLRDYPSGPHAALAKDILGSTAP